MRWFRHETKPKQPRGCSLVRYTKKQRGLFSIFPFMDQCLFPVRFYIRFHSFPLEVYIGTSGRNEDFFEPFPARFQRALFKRKKSDCRLLKVQPANIQSYVPDSSTSRI